MTFLLCCFGTTQSFADHWFGSSKLGFIEYTLTNPQQHALMVSCNRNAGNQYDHSVSFMLNHQKYHNTARQAPLSLLIDQQLHIVPPATTTWRMDAQQWNNLKNALATATHVDVLLNKQKVSSFNPSTQSVNTVAKELQGCDALG